MVSHQATEGNPNIRALQDSANVHMTDRDDAYPPSGRRSRLANHRPLGDSMLAYTQRMREIAQFRQDSALRSSEDCASGVSPDTGVLTDLGLWKKGPQQSRRPQRPLSLDELIGRQTKEDSLMGIPKKKNRRYSVPNRISAPTVSPVPAQNKDKPRVHISFVSASDLFELVSFSLCSKTSRDESLKQARYEESLKLMKDSNFLESVSSRQTLKAVEVPSSKAPDRHEDKETLAVHGVPSPRDTQKVGPKTKWLRRNGEKLSGVSEVSKAPQHDETSREPSQHSVDLLREKHLILLQPQRLRYRPKRAKRMTLHRSLLSAIPEDGRRRQETTTAQAQDPPSTRLPVVPSSSSLTAIRNTRKGRERNAPTIETKVPRDIRDTNDHHSVEDSPSKPSSGQGPGKTTPPTRNSHAESVDDVEPRNPSDDKPAKKQATPRDDTSAHALKDAFPRRRRRRSTSDRKSSWQGDRPVVPQASRARSRALNAQSLALVPPESRTRAQKKFSKLIFLRDTPDHTCDRYS